MKLLKRWSFFLTIVLRQMQLQVQNLMPMQMLNTRTSQHLLANFLSKDLFVSTADYLLIVLRRCMVRTWLMSTLTFWTTILYIRMTRQTSPTIVHPSLCTLGLLEVQIQLVAIRQRQQIWKVSVVALLIWYSWCHLCSLELALRQNSWCTWTTLSKRNMVKTTGSVLMKLLILA